MNQILVFGAGRSSLFLIEYLAQWAEKNQYLLLVCDREISYAQTQLRALNGVTFQELELNDLAAVSKNVEESNLIVSLLPAALHIQIARLCLQFGKHLATASYISEEMKALNAEAQSKGLIFLNEMGLDPGIDHMSAMEMLDKIRDAGGRITGFKSYTGGLVADENDGDNPWKYKFTWNPRNVVLAAQGPPAVYLENGQLKLMPYHQIFAHPLDFEIPAYGPLQAYPNRDSMKYIDAYGLQDVQNMLRGTLRKPGYCAAWQVFVALGMTDDLQVLNLPPAYTLKDWLCSYLPGDVKELKTALKAYTSVSDAEIEKLEWLGFFSEQPLPVTRGTSAAILEEVLKQKWVLEETDRDLIVMLHQIDYLDQGQAKRKQATLVLKGQNHNRTAMAKTVGLPLAIGCKLILENSLTARGVMAPLSREIYQAVLEELESFGILFQETEDLAL